MVFNEEEYKKQYYQRNRERILARVKKYRIENQDKIKEYNAKNKEKISFNHKKYCQEHKDQIREYNEKNKEKRKVQIKKWRKNNKEKYLLSQKNFLENHPNYRYLAVKKYRQKYPQKHRDENKKWINNNKEKYSSAKREYYLNVDKENRKLHPEKEFARSFAHRYLKKLQPNCCEICGSQERLEMHHPDYSLYEIVITLCKKHHTRISNPNMNVEGVI